MFFWVREVQCASRDVGSRFPASGFELIVLDMTSFALKLEFCSYSNDTALLLFWCNLPKIRVFSPIFSHYLLLCLDFHNYTVLLNPFCFPAILLQTPLLMFFTLLEIINSSTIKRHVNSWANYWYFSLFPMPAAPHCQM